MKGGAGEAGEVKETFREINSCRTKDFKIISSPAPSSPFVPPALKEFLAYQAWHSAISLVILVSSRSILLVVEVVGYA